MASLQTIPSMLSPQSFISSAKISLQLLNGLASRPYPASSPYLSTLKAIKRTADAMHGWEKNRPDNARKSTISNNPNTSVPMAGHVLTSTGPR